MTTSATSPSVAFYDGHINRHPHGIEWGVVNVHGGVRHYPGSGKAGVERACNAASGERVVFRYVFTSDWTDAESEH